MTNLALFTSARQAGVNSEGYIKINYVGGKLSRRYWVECMDEMGGRIFGSGHDFAYENNKNHNKPKARNGMVCGTNWPNSGPR